MLYCLWDLVPQPGIEPVSHTVEEGVLTTGPPGKASELRSLIENLEAISDCDDCSLGHTGE